MSILFRHRSSLLLLLVWPIATWTLGPRAPNRLELGVGATLIAAGGALRLTSARCLGRGARVHRADARGGLVSWGPYAWSRNPLYLAAALVATGLALAAGSGPWGLSLLPVTLVIYLPVVLHEEEVIRQQVGAAYDAYAKAVPRWVGRPSRVRGARSGARTPWSRVLRREWRLIPGLVAALGGVLLVRADLIPLRAALVALGDPLSLPVEVTAGAVLALGMAGNSLAVERKRRRQNARRRCAATGVETHDAPAWRS